MISDTLYALAFEFRQSKLWNKLYDTQLFAIRHSDGSIGYCCVIGMMGEHLALAVYSGDRGLDAYREMGRDRSLMDDFELQETALAQDCVMVSFENKSELRPREVEEASAYANARGRAFKDRKAYTQFQRLRPHYYPWYVDEPIDQEHLAEALKAALEASERLGTIARPHCQECTA